MPTVDNKYLRSLEFDKVLALVSNHAKTISAKEELLNLTPYETKEEIEFQISLTTEAKTVLDNEGVNSFPVDFAFDPDKILTVSRLSVENIIDLTKTLKTSRKLKSYLTRNKEYSPLINLNFCEKLFEDKELEDKISGVFDENYNIKDNATPELKKLKNSLRANSDNLRSSINSLLKDSTFTSYLQDAIYTERMGRTVFQVKATDKSKVKGIIHDVSASNQTFFIEPEILVNINNKIRQIECEIEAEIERILFNLSLEFHKIKSPLTDSFLAIRTLDIIFAKAKYSIITNSTPPLITDKKVVKLYSMRHPLLNTEKVVENDFEIGENYKSLLITGSNTGGKTVTLKTVGLAILMAKAGFHVLSKGAVIYPFEKVFSDIEERQDIAQSLSTFSAHIKNIANIIDHIKENDIVLFDELGAGTDPTEGAALARAILEYLDSKGITTITTTHLGELKILQYQNNNFKNASVEFDKVTMKPTYKLIIGLAGSSYAIDIAKNYNLKPEITDLAKQFINQNSNPNTKIFNEIQQTHQELIERTKTIEKTKISAVQKEEELDEKLKEIKTKKKKTLETFKKKYQSSLEIARKEIKETLDELRKEKSEKIARRSYSRLAKLEEAARQEFTKDEDELTGKYPEINWEEIKLGQSVLIKGINQPAIISSYPDSKGMVEIKIGLIKSKVHKSKLAKTDKKVSKQIKKLTVSFDDFHNSLSFSPRLDLRGMRVEEALDEIEHHLDLAVSRNINSFTVIHGHGTGALKSAIRDYLNTSPYVLKYRAGTDTEGGDGVSVIDVK